MINRFIGLVEHGPERNAFGERRAYAGVLLQREAAPRLLGRI
jgi:hypothetical protein